MTRTAATVGGRMVHVQRVVLANGALEGAPPGQVAAAKEVSRETRANSNIHICPEIKHLDASEFGFLTNLSVRCRYVMPLAASACSSALRGTTTTIGFLGRRRIWSSTRSGGLDGS